MSINFDHELLHADQEEQRVRAFIRGIVIAQIVFIACVFAGCIIGVALTCKTVKQAGVKSVIERVWNGPGGSQQGTNNGN